LSINKKISILLSAFLFLLGIAGCGTQAKPTTSLITQSKVPEPYTLALEKLNAGDLDMALKYTDFVINDFKDSPYIYNAQLIKSTILVSKLTVNGIKVSYMLDGMHRMGTLNNMDDVNKVKSYSDFIIAQGREYEASLKEPIRYVLVNFDESDVHKVKFPDPPSSLTAPSKSDFGGLSWFADVGYPIPKEDEIKGDDKEGILKAFYWIAGSYSKTRSFSYPDFFYNASIKIEDVALRKDLLNKVLQLTESDKYNEIRINAQEDLIKLK